MLAQGTRLNEAHLATLLGVSRGPLREALRTLEEEGLVASSPNRGFSVFRATETDILEMLQVRARLEPLAVELSLQRSRHDVLRDLQECVERMSTAARLNDRAMMAAAHVAFHSVFYESANHTLLLKIWRRWQIILPLYFATHQEAFPSLQEVFHEHESLLSALASGHPDGIHREVTRHFVTRVPDIVAATHRDPNAADNL